MRVLQVSLNDVEGGAAISAYRQNMGLVKAGISSKLLVANQRSGSKEVIRLGPKSRHFSTAVRGRLESYLLRSIRGQNKGVFSTGLFPSDIHNVVNQSDVDIINLHWICCGLASISSIGKVTKPIVWTLHDMWPFTGGCHYNEECAGYKSNCSNCPQVSGALAKLVPTYILKKKQRNWEKKFDAIVAPSRWLANCAKNSRLFADKNIMVIPYGIDSHRFHPLPKDVARDIWDLPLDKKIVLFGAMNATGDPRKGFTYLVEALKLLKKLGSDIELVVFGASDGGDLASMGFPVHFVGNLYDEVSIAILYSVADVMVVPSVQDNLPNTVLESMACGTPCVAFDIGGMPDMIDHKVNGYLASPFDAQDIAKGIEWILDESDRGRDVSNAARTKILEHYSPEKMADNYFSLYKKILDSKSSE